MSTGITVTVFTLPGVRCTIDQTGVSVVGTGLCIVNSVPDIPTIGVTSSLAFGTIPVSFIVFMHGSTGGVNVVVGAKVVVVVGAKVVVVVGTVVDAAVVGGTVVGGTVVGA
jgi:hypothetical protein